VEFSGFQETVKLHWDSNHFYSNSAKTISGKFKQLRKGLKSWSRELSRLNKNINNAGWVVALLDGLEEARTLSILEKTFGR
jgi:hypothetical protein